MGARIILAIITFNVICFGSLKAQTVTQTIKGTVVDRETQVALPGATVVILGTNPLKGTSTNADGFYKIESVPVGRYNIKVSFLGYEPYVMQEILVGSGKEVVLNVELKESLVKMQEVVIKADANKEAPLNSMATISAKQLSVEEANRYAGGFDDPARLVSSFAGVTYNVGNNGIVIRGNSPKSLLWQMEGVQIPNPNHFADYISLGGGAVTALSSQTMANSDFFTGAFPAEYGNALSGVFDIKMRTGNTEKREYAFQAGVIGIDFAAEGPFTKGKRSSYLFNYRYSTLGLLSPILPKEMGVLTYQDLSFKLNFPTKKAGTFTLWGIGALDYQGNEAEKDSLLWKNNDAREEFHTNLSMGAAGFSHKKIFGTNTYIYTTLAPTESSFEWSQKRYDDALNLVPKRKLTDNRWKYTLTSYINHKFSARHTNKTGFILNRLMYNIDIKAAEEYGDTLLTYVSERNGSNLMQFFSQSKINLRDNVTLNLGVHSQYFALNDKYSIEPRCGVRWNFMPRHTLNLAYGLHSQLEIIHLYLIQQTTANEIVMPNKNLDFGKAHHFVLGYDIQLTENTILKIEPYYQRLYDIPVVPNSYISTINLSEVWSFNDSLVNTGTGKNIGIDFTLEKFLSKGFYYLITASLFDSKYTGGDGIERNTRYNKNYVVNVLAGKEWFTGANKNNIFGANIRFTYMGGDRIHPLNITETMANEEITEDVTRAYQDKLPDAPILCFSLSYKKNKPKYSGIWSFQMINALAHKEFQEYQFDKETKTIEKKYDTLIIPNISYKIEF